MQIWGESKKAEIAGGRGFCGHLSPDTEIKSGSLSRHRKHRTVSVACCQSRRFLLRGISLTIEEPAHRAFGKWKLRTCRTNPGSGRLWCPRNDPVASKSSCSREIELILRVSSRDWTFFLNYSIIVLWRIEKFKLNLRSK